MSAVPANALRWELTGAGIESLGPGGAPVSREVTRPGPGQLLARVDACGICFSDIKILNLGASHPRLRGRDLVRDPRETIERLYQHFEWRLTEGNRARLDDATRRQRDFKSLHEYTLEEFGLSKNWIQQELGEIMDFYKLDR